jgi:hypothetical protein
VQDNVRAAPRLMALVAIALVATAIAAFALLSGSDVAGAAGTSSSTSNGQLQPIQSNGQAAPDDAAQPNGRDCPKDQQGAGGNGSGDTGQQAAPSQSNPGTEL